MNNKIVKTTFFALVVLLPFMCRATDIPTRDMVGAGKAPAEIAPIAAPFEMPQPERPQFPQLSMSIDECGAKQNELSTAAIQKAINEISTRGGGTVIIPKGKWLTGRIELKSNINLHLEQEAELHFSGEIKDYLPVVFTRNEGVEMYSLGALIYANGAENIAITGKGKLIAQGTDCEIFRKSSNEIAVEILVPHTTPLQERIYDGQEGREFFLPMFFAPINCKNILVEGVSFEKSIFWNIVPQYCQDIIIRDVTVNSAGHGRTDGIDIESSRNALIEYVTLNCGDDCFTIKSGRGEDGQRVNKPSENIVIRHCWAQAGAGSVVCGSETASMIRNMYVHDCVFDGTSNGLYFKTRRPRGGGGENLYYQRLRISVPGPALKWDMLGSVKWVGELAERMPARPLNALTPVYRDIVMKDIVIEKCGQLIDMISIPESPVTGVLIENLKADCQKLINIQDADGLVLLNADITSQEDHIKILDSRNIMMINVDVNSSEQLEIEYSGTLSRPVIISR